MALLHTYKVLGKGPVEVDGQQKSLHMAMQGLNQTTVVVADIEGILNALSEEGWEPLSPSLDYPYIFRRLTIVKPK